MPVYDAHAWFQSAGSGTARTLGYEVVAEGVETARQRQFLEAYGCDEIQGYLLSRPLPAAEFARWIADRERRTGRGDGAA